MKEYLFKEKFDQPSDELFIVKAKNIDDAYQKAAKVLHLADEMFIDHMSMRTINMSFAEKFWIQTDEEIENFSDTGKVIIDVEEFIKRAEEYFGDYKKACSEYLAYLFYNEYKNDDEERAAYLKFARAHDDFLISEWIEYTDYEIIDISKIKRL